MKTTFKLAILFIFILSAGYITSAAEKTKKFNQSWPAAGIETLRISNKFGEVKFKNDNASTVSINVLVTVEASSESKATEIINNIDVKINKSGSVVTAETIFENNFRGNNRFKIDYEINVPSDRNLEVSNKYGNVVVGQLTGKGDFDVQYGSITAVSLKGISTRINLAYGKGNIDESGNTEIEVAYSDISMGTVGNLRLNSKYSNIEADKAADIQTESRYDKFNFGEVVALNADTKYTQIRVGKLSKKLYIGAGYGGIKIDNISPDFESINITNSYGQISLGLGSASYSLDAKCSYCGVDYPADRYKGNRMKENTSIQLNGTVGSGGGKVKIDSRYGEIKLQ